MVRNLKSCGAFGNVYLPPSQVYGVTSFSPEGKGIQWNKDKSKSDLNTDENGSLSLAGCFCNVLSYQRRSKVLFSACDAYRMHYKGERRQIAPVAFPVRPLQGKGKIAETLLIRIARILPCII